MICASEAKAKAVLKRQLLDQEYCDILIDQLSNKILEAVELGCFRVDLAYNPQTLKDGYQKKILEYFNELGYSIEFKFIANKPPWIEILW